MKKSRLVKILRRLNVFVLLTFFSLQITASGYSQNIMINQTNARLEEVFVDINKQTGYISRVRQSNGRTDSEPLNIGDTVPEIKLEVVNDPAEIINLSVFEGKVKLIYFWSASCPPAISKLELLDSMQRLFVDRIKIIVITGKGFPDSKTQVLKYKNWKGKSLLFVKENETINQLFPHSSVPHYAWIGADGTVKAMMSTDLVSKEVIEKFLNEDVHLIAYQKINEPGSQTF